MMKKLLALLFAVCLLLPCAFAEDDLDSHQVTPTLCNVIDRSAYEWYESNASRSLLAACVLLDFPSEERPDIWEEMSGGFAYDRIYVAKNEGQLNVYFFGVKMVVLAIYDPDGGVMLVAILGDTIENPVEFMKYMVAGDNLESYYAVDNDDIMEMIDMVIEILSE